MNELRTPSFVIRESKINALTSNLFKALNEYFPKSIASYSFKTNNLPWLINHMKSLGLFAEVVSSDEYVLARNLGFPISNIIFNGPVKGKKEFIEAVENGAIVNIDSKRELQWLSDCDIKTQDKWRLGLRINFCLEEVCPGETQGGIEDGRFGFSIESGELSEAINFMIVKGYPLSGIHLHCSSKTRSLNIYKAIAATAIRLINDYDLNLDFIDVGGGFFGGVPGKPTFVEYFKELKSILLQRVDLNKTTIIVEPGISIVGSGIDYITEVVDVKKTKSNTFVVLDGSRIHIDPLMRKSTYTFQIIRNNCVSGNEEDQILCGFTCMENDRFFHFKDKILKVGDNVIFEKVGAYTMGLSPQFIESSPLVYVDKGGECIIVRDKEELPVKIHIT